MRSNTISYVGNGFISQTEESITVHLSETVLKKFLVTTSDL